MKIAIIVRRLDVKGGTQRQVLELARTLQRMGSDITVYTFVYNPSGCYQEYTNGDIKIVSLCHVSAKQVVRRVRRISSILHYFADIQRSKCLVKLIDDDTEVLHPVAESSHRVAYYFKKKHRFIPSAWMINDMPAKLASFERAHSVDPSITLSALKKLLYWLVDMYELHRYIRAQDQLLVLDQRDRRWVWLYYRRKAVVVRPGLNIDRFSYRKRTQLNPSLITMLSVGIFLPHRRFEDIIEALRLLSQQRYNVKLHIVGGVADQKYHKKIVNLIKQYRLNDRVELLGRVTDQALQKHYADSDVFIFASHMQSWGLAVSEAQASGLPVIVSRTTGASEVLTHKKNALIVDQKNPSAIASALQLLIDDSQLYAKLSEQGRSFVEKNISWDKYAATLHDIFQQYHVRKR